MADQVVDAAMGRTLHADACRAHPLVGWIVMRDLPEYPEKVIARLVTEAPSPYVLIADTLAELHAQLPPYLARAGRQPADPSEMVERFSIVPRHHPDEERGSPVRPPSARLRHAVGQDGSARPPDAEPVRRQGRQAIPPQAAAGACPHPCRRPSSASHLAARNQAARARPRRWELVSDQAGARPNPRPRELAAAPG